MRRRLISGASSRSGTQRKPSAYFLLGHRGQLLAVSVLGLRAGEHLLLSLLLGQGFPAVGFVEHLLRRAQRAHIAFAAGRGLLALGERLAGFGP